MAKKTYVPTLLNLSVKLCRYIARATPVITQLYGSNATLMAALAAANAACNDLAQELAAVREYGD